MAAAVTPSARNAQGAAVKDAVRDRTVRPEYLETRGGWNDLDRACGEVAA